MIKKAISLAIIIIYLILFCPLLKASAKSDPAEENAGYALLDTVFVTFKELAEMREPVMEKTNKALANMMKEAKNAKAQNQIDDVFFKRFHRILLVLKIVITPVEKDEGDIMGPLYFGEINRFIEDIEGEKYDVQKAVGREAINKLSQAISHEIIELRLYLDTKEKREKLIKEYEELVGIEVTVGSESSDQVIQLNSMKEASYINQAMTDYMTDFGAPPKQAGTYTRGGEFNEALSPFYIKELPISDDWEGNYRIYSGKACNGVYDGIEDCTERDILIVSYGRDGKKENWRYDPKKPEAGLYELKSEKDYDKDLVIWNGKWIRAPQIVKKKK
ncbi:MAG: hypothetical protein JSV17_10390 [Candidatus Aminicenantes bacterium]|nr:MAG: hypothetical protein JSV17_10390 [Candidatus Aminicenantes bacterium]